MCVKMKTVTIKNGQELENYDAFVVWLEEIQEKFIASKGYPTLPENWPDGIKLYDKATKDEKRMIVSRLVSTMVEFLRHWKVDRDELYGKDGWQKFIY